MSGDVNSSPQQEKPNSGRTESTSAEPRDQQKARPQRLAFLKRGLKASRWLVSGLFLGFLRGLFWLLWPRPSKAFWALTGLSLVMDALILGVVELKHEFRLLDPIVLIFFAKKLLLDLALIAAPSLLILRVHRRGRWPAFAIVAASFLLILVDTAVYFFGNTLFMHHHIAFATWTALKFFISPAVIAALIFFSIILFLTAKTLDALQPHASYRAALRWGLLGLVLFWFQPNNYIYKIQDSTERLDHYIFRFRNSQLEYATQNSVANFTQQMLGEGEAHDYVVTKDFSALAPVAAKHDLQLGQAPPPNLALKPFKRIILLTVESLSLEFLGPYNKGLRVDTSPAFFSQPQIQAQTFSNYWASAEPTLPGLTVSYMSHPNYELAEPTHHPNAFPRLLADQGFKTFFFRSASRFYADENIILKDIGFQKIIAREDFFRDPEMRKYIYGWGLEDRKLYEQLVDLLDKHRDEKIFVNVLGADTHPPHGQEHYKHLKYPALPKDFTKTYGPTVTRFLKSIYHLDYDLKGLVDLLKAKDLFTDETLIIITADHSCPYNYLLKQIPDYPHDSIARIPLIFLTPQTLPKVDHAQLASQLDLAPTLFHLLGLPPAPGWWGQSLYAKERRVPAISFDAKILVERRQQGRELYNFKDPGRLPKDLRTLFNSIFTGTLSNAKD